GRPCYAGGYCSRPAVRCKLPFLPSAAGAPVVQSSMPSRRALRDMGVLGSVSAMDGAIAAYMDVFAAVPKPPITQRPTRAAARAHQRDATWLLAPLRLPLRLLGVVDVRQLLAGIDGKRRIRRLHDIRADVLAREVERVFRDVLAPQLHLLRV